MKNIIINLFALTFLFSSSISSANLRISPLKIELKKQTKKMDSVIIHNGVDKVKHFQVTVLKKKSDGTFMPTKELIAVPTVFKVRPKKEQLVRVALRSTGSGDVDNSNYRIAIKELPQGRIKPGTVQLITEMTVPVDIDD